MTVYLDLAMLLNGLVDFLLLLGAERLTGYPIYKKRLLLAAVLGGVYGGIALVPGFLFLGNFLWRSVFSVLICLTAFGLQRSAISRGAVFVFLSLALGGVAAAMTEHNVLRLAAAGAGLVILCKIGFREPPGAKKLLPARLSYGGRQISVLAFHDTGNCLRDPITGEQVLVADSEVAGKLLSLEPTQLRHPLEAMGQVPGLRLIPYHSVGSAGGLLLAVRLPRVEIGSFQGSAIMAFAPDPFHGDYQVLTGGAI